MKMRFVVLLVILCVLVGCSSKTVIPMASIAYDQSESNGIIYLEIKGNNKPVFALYGNGFLEIRRDFFQNEMENKQLTEQQVKRLLNHLINKQRIGDLESNYPEEVIPGIDMYPNFDFVLEVKIDGFQKQINFAYSSVCDELEDFKEEGRIDEETFDELCKLRAVYNYLIQYKL
jgi:hypothetical protein